MLTNAFGQVKISFESTEGYNVGQLAGQQSWATWGGLLDMDTFVVTSHKTDGNNGMYVESYMDIMDFCGVEKPVTLLSSNKYEISFDYKHEGFGDSDYQIDFYNLAGTTYNQVGAIKVGYISGAVSYANMSTVALVTSTTSLAPDTWYNLKMVIDKSLSTASYYVNNTLLGSTPLGATTDTNLLDFTFDDFGTGFYVDNIRMNDLTLGTAETATKAEIKLFPNPTVDYLNISSPNKITWVEIFDGSGKTVYQSTSDSTKIDVAALTHGMYVVKVKTTTGETTTKFIKK